MIVKKVEKLYSGENRWKEAEGGERRMRKKEKEEGQGVRR